MSINAKALTPEALYQRCDPQSLPFETTDELEDLSEVLGQTRALDAVRFGIGIRREGYNLYALGPSGIGKQTVIRQFLEREAPREEKPSDWIYVNNFAHPHKPKSLRLPPGRGPALRADMAKLVDTLRTAIPSSFESEEYHARGQELEQEFKERQEQAIREIHEEAEHHGITLLRTPGGFAFAPTKDEEVLSPEEFEKLSKEEQQRIEQVVSSLQEKLQKVLRLVPQWRQESRERLKELNREVAGSVVDHLIDELKQSYADLPEVLTYLDGVRQDVIDNVDDFRKHEESPAAMLGIASSQAPSFRRYEINVLVDHSQDGGAPVVYEDHPTYANLVGRVEHLAQLGALVTDFTLIKPGALHQANGGYLMLDAHKVLLQPYAWEGLKRVLTSREIRIESLGQMLSLVSTVSLEPEPIALDVKVVLLGERLLYYLLCEYDPEFTELFKVAADFEDQLERTEENSLLYARMVGTLVRKEGLKPFDRTAVARVLEHGSRQVEDAERLSIHMRTAMDLLREADYWAGEGGSTVVTASDVQKAIDTQIYRASRLKERVHEAIERGIVLIDTEGNRVGQINGLSVLHLGDHMFGQPSRITATTRLGEGEVVDIEREVDLGGALHSKGVLILSNFLAARFAQERPLSLSASLVFEQSYGGVDGDSASVAELCALMSSLAELPVNQSLAVTGSVNQHGQVQAIGGVNEKIEGFFDVCKTRGLNGEQGVLIPASNVKHLMLRNDVVEAAKAGQFHIYPVETIDQAMELFMNTPAGERDEQGQYPEDTINQRVEARLTHLAELRREFGEHKDKGGEEHVFEDETHAESRHDD